MSQDDLYGLYFNPDAYDSSSFYSSQYSPSQHDGRPGRPGRDRDRRGPGRDRRDGRHEPPRRREPRERFEPPRRAPWRPEPAPRAPWRPEPAPRAPWRPEPEPGRPRFKNVAGPYRFYMGYEGIAYGEAQWSYDGTMALQQAPGTSQVRGYYDYQDKRGRRTNGTLVGYMNEYKNLSGTYRNADGREGSFELDMGWGRRTCFRGQFVEGYTYGCPGTTRPPLSIPRY